MRLPYLGKAPYTRRSGGLVYIPIVKRNAHFRIHLSSACVHFVNSDQL